MNKYFFEEIVLEDKGFLRGPFGGDLKKEIFIPKAHDTYKVYEQGVVLQKDVSIGDYYISNEYFQSKMRRFEVQPKDFLVSCSGVNYGAIYQLGENIEKGVINQALLRIRLNNKIIDDNYFYYLFQHHLVNLIVGKKGDSTIPNFPPISVIKKLKLELPTIGIQKQGGAILKNIDFKIELNNKINAELEAMAKLIYDYWFVQFDFPNTQGKPYKASGGKMVWSEELKREVPQGWKVRNLGQLMNIFDSERIPLSRSEREKRFGKIPYYGATGVMGFVDDFIFNDDFILLAEDGSVMDEKGLPIVQFIWGKTWVNNHAHVLQAKQKANNEYLYQLVKTISVIQIVTGSIQLKINQENLKNVVTAEPHPSILDKFSKILIPIRKSIIKNIEANRKLEELRDWLLPMLMNGQIKVSDTVNKRVDGSIAKEAKPANVYFHQKQVIASIINASNKNNIKHGEMTLAKYSYLIDKIYKVPTYFKYDRWHLGPYPTEMKKVVNNKQFFKIQNNEVSVVTQSKEYTFQYQKQIEAAVTDLATILNQYKGKDRSRQTELLATVCKVVEDIQSADLKAVRESMKQWPIKLKDEKFKNKAEKFGEEETALCLKILAGKKWDALLLS